jgi:hypothetical protein
MGKSNQAEKNFHVYEKGKALTLCSNFELAVGDDVVVDEDVDEREPPLLITELCDSVTVSDFKPGKQGLKSQLRPVLRRGGMFLTHYLFT